MDAGLAAAALTPVAKLAITEPYQIVHRRVASSKNLEHMYDQLNHDLQELLAIKEDKESQVPRHRQNDTTPVYHLWAGK